MAYFGVLKAAATVVPVDRELEGRGAGERRARLGRGRSAHRRRSARQGRRRAGGGLRRGRAHHQALAVLGGLRAPRPGGREGARRQAHQARQPRRAGVADLHLGDDRQAQGGDAHPPQLHLHGVGAVEDLRVRRQRRDALGAAAAPHLRVRHRPPGSAGARRAGHLPDRADRRADLVDAQAGAGDRHRRRPGAVGSAAPPAVPALRRQVADPGRLHEGAGGGQLRAALAHRVRPGDSGFSPRPRRVRRAHPLPHQRRLGAAAST